MFATNDLADRALKDSEMQPEQTKPLSDLKVREKARLAAALRENLKRRKAQVRSRTAAKQPGSE